MNAGQANASFAIKGEAVYYGYTEQPNPDRMVLTHNGAVYAPAATLKDTAGNVAHIVRTDDGEYVLITGNYVDGFRTDTHWDGDCIASLFKLVARVTVEIRRK